MIVSLLMTINLLFGFLSEFFLSCSILYALVYNSFLVKSSYFNYPLIEEDAYNQTLFVLFLTSILLVYNYDYIISSASLFIVDCCSTNCKIVVLISSIFSIGISRPYLIYNKINSFEYYSIKLLAVFSMCFLLSSLDCISMYLSMEMLALCLYVLSSFKRFSCFSVEAGLKYFVLGSITSGIILFGCVLIYGVFGSTNMNEIFIINSCGEFSFSLSNIPFYIGISFVIIGFLFKLGAAPFHVWLPDVYEGSPFSSTVFFALVPKIVYIMLLARLCFYSFNSFFVYFQPLFFFCGILSIIIGSLGALNQTRVKRLLVYSSITHVGFILLSFSCGTIFSLCCCFFYICLYIINNALVWGLLMLVYNKETETLHLTSFARVLSLSSFVGLGLVVGLFSLAGIPPFSGFFMKIFAFVSAYSSGLLETGLTILFLSVIGAFYYIRFIKIVCFEN
mgnify:CR=1 FL=1